MWDYCILLQEYTAYEGVYHYQRIPEIVIGQLYEEQQMK